MPAAPARPENRPILSLGLSDRGRELLTFGDRNFRADDLRRAARRYRQAMASAPLSALPRGRLAQVAFVRGDYRDAADRLREAITAEPDWLLGARDVQALYAEPADFHDALAMLESHLQARPDDRDAWLVLGTQLLLSDRPGRAADVVLRLDGRQPDPLLAALRVATGIDH
jgi:predicted Zn-dependent protease